MAREPLSPQQKLSLGVVIVIGITTFVFGAFQLNRSIVLPFVRDTSVTFKTVDDIEREREAQLKVQDTDGDGLNDYDELYLFRTSPFLADSDSDGMSDGQEVAQASNPNCPAGKTCRQAPISGGSGAPSSPTGPLGSSGSSVATGQIPGISEQEQGILNAIQTTFGDLEELTPEAMSERIRTMSSDELRNFLEQLGIPRQALDQADDSTLRGLLEEALGETEEDPNVNAAAEEAEAAEQTEGE